MLSKAMANNVYIYMISKVIIEDIYRGFVDVIECHS